MNEIEKDLEGCKAKLIYEDKDKVSKKYVEVKQMNERFLEYLDKNHTTQYMPMSRVVRIVKKKEDYRDKIGEDRNDRFDRDSR